MAYSRENLSSKALIDRSRIYAAGTFKNVWRGEYTSGSRAGQKCVSKEFRSGSIFENYGFQEELDISFCTQNIIDKWNCAKIVERDIMLNTPEIWNAPNGRKSLVEPFIENFEKFNSNSGWAVSGNAWCEAMQALSHFSYDMTGGRWLLCDLQGGIYKDG